MKTFLSLILALALPGMSAAAEPTDYVAHEWGTFTSVQGADGEQLQWNPLVTTELPKFVYDRNRLRNSAGLATPFLVSKTGLVARQRLETPVIYFYSKEPREVNVSVMFPEGTVTEWYPQQNPIPTPIARRGEPAARWQQLQILAPNAEAPQPPRESVGSHYYAARIPEANTVQIAGSAGSETEQFLFYRGVGSFTAPLNVKIAGNAMDALQLTNLGREPLQKLFVYEVAGGDTRLGSMSALPPGESRPFAFDASAPRLPLAAGRAKLADQMERALVDAGLYQAEARAMVKTWDDAWFAEPGLRVLYLLPRAWTDRVLPLTLDPTPREVARVMVGRAEVITPQVTRALQTQIERFRTGDEAERGLAVASARAIGLGRFAEPAVRLVSLAQKENRAAFGNAAWELLQAAFSPPKPQPVATR